MIKRKGILLKEILTHRYDPIDVEPWVNEVYREIKEGEEVKVTVYDENSSFLDIEYYDIKTTDGFSCKVNIDSIKLL
jgi:hypothetical protein